MAAAARACVQAGQAPCVRTGRSSNQLTGVCLRVCSPPASSSLGVCHRRVCPCDRARVRASESAIRGRLSSGGPLGLRITGGSCVLGGSVKPRVCACAVTGVGVLGGTAKERLGRWLGGGTVGPALGCALPWGPLGLLFCYPPQRRRVGATLRQASPGVLSACEPTPCFTTTRLALGSPGVHRGVPPLRTPRPAPVCAPWQ